MESIIVVVGRKPPSIRAPDRAEKKRVRTYSSISSIINTLSMIRKRERTNQIKFIKTMKNEIKIHKSIYPFQIVEQNKTYFVAVGNQKLSSKEFTKLADARRYIESKPYELIINVCCFAMSMNNEQTNTKNKENNEKDNKENA